MNYLIASAVASAAQADQLQDLPDFRRATLNMRLAFAAANPLLQKIPAGIPRHRIALVLGTSLGELQSTYDFLAGLALENVARPLAFQNSLHHSTLGFLSRVMNVTGPGITTSREYFSGEDALDIGCRLLEAGEADYAVVIGVDITTAALNEVVEMRINRSAASGAGACLLTRQATPGAGVVLGAIELEEGPALSLATEDFFDSNAVALLAIDLVPGTFLFPKPDGKVSRITLGSIPRV